MLPLLPYLDQLARWPRSGRHILAHHDQRTIVVYQAYRASIAEFATRHQRFGGEFSFSRMSWIKPNFLWMMFRSGWATKLGQERVLAVRIERAFFERVLAAAVASTHWPERHASREEWQAALRGSQVRLQWDPDHDPGGAPVERRALQLGLRGAVLEEYATRALVEVIDVTPLVEAERGHARAPYADLSLPVEDVFTPSDPAAARAVMLDVGGA